MKYLRFLILNAIVFIAFSCNEKIVEDFEAIRTYATIDVPAKALIDRVDFVKLETTTDNLIGSVSKILFTDSLIIIVDKNKAKAVYVFDKNGRYMRKIGKIGSSPFEYDHISDVVLSFDKTKIHILGINRLITYDLNGKFLKSDNTKTIIHLIESVDKNTFATYNRSGYFTSKKNANKNLLEIVDINFDKVLFSGVKSNYQRNGTLKGYEFPLINVNGKVYLMPEISDTVFQVTEKEVIPRYFIQTEKPKPKSDDIKNSAKNASLDLTKRFNGGFFGIDDYIIVYMIFSDRPLVFYNTKTKKSYSYDVYKIKDTHPLLAFTNTLKTQYKSSLVTVVSPTKLISRKENLYKYYDNKLIDRLFYNMTEDDNPVLLFYHVNKNVPQ